VLEDKLRRAAFGDLPCLPLGEVSASASSGEQRVRLLAAVLLGAKGRYAAAMTVLDELRRGPDRLVASLATSTLASHRRQLGGHAAARGLDGVALLMATTSAEVLADADGLDVPGAISDALLGLAADNLALGRIAAARRLAASAADVPCGWRGRVRAGWVGAEIELAAGRPEAAVPPAEAAAGLAHGRGALRHSIKSDLVLGASLAAAGGAEGRERAVSLVSNALEAAEKGEFDSLIWPACLIAVDVRADMAQVYRFRATQVLHAVLRHADARGRRIAQQSPWVPT
jgi:hypothetical protein